MPTNAIELFKEKSHNNYEKNETFKLAKFGKIYNNNINDFSYKFLGKEYSNLCYLHYYSKICRR